VKLDRPCPYYLGENIVGSFADYLNEFEYDRIAIVAGRTPFELFGDEFTGALSKRDIPHFSVAIEDTEVEKGWRSLASLCEKLLEGGVTRDSIIIALGGGVTGNIAGMAAGLIYRGVRFVEVPTTMMAQTDSVLSQKQAINGSTGKNQFGLYHSPIFIWADVAYVKTEPVRQVKAAIVEGIKNGLVNSPHWLGELSARLSEGITNIYGSLTDFTRMIVNSKLAILDCDPSEKKDAIILEYGHTFGHAIEWVSRGSLLHGEAVSIGMCAAAQLSSALGIMDDDILAMHYYTLGELLGTPVRIPEGLRTDDIYATMLRDNKRNRAGLTCLLLKEPGCLYKVGGSYLTKINEADARCALEAARTDMGLVAHVGTN
jgi:3-dehydroquinate synthetase